MFHCDPPLRSALPSSPPWDLTFDGSGVNVLVVSSALKLGGKHGDCRQTGQLASDLTARLSLEGLPPLTLQGH